MHPRRCASAGRLSRGLAWAGPVVCALVLTTMVLWQRAASPAQPVLSSETKPRPVVRLRPATPRVSQPRPPVDPATTGPGPAPPPPATARHQSAPVLVLVGTIHEPTGVPAVRATVRTTLTRYDGGLPVRRITGRVRCGADGRFELRIPRDGEHAGIDRIRLRVWTGLGSLNEVVPLAPGGGRQTVAFELEPYAPQVRLAGRVLREGVGVRDAEVRVKLPFAGAPRPPVGVDPAALGGTTHVFTTGLDGRFEGDVSIEALGSLEHVHATITEQQTGLRRKVDPSRLRLSVSELRQGTATVTLAPAPPPVTLRVIVAERAQGSYALYLNRGPREVGRLRWKRGTPLVTTVRLPPGRYEARIQAPDRQHVTRKLTIAPGMREVRLEGP